MPKKDEEMSVSSEAKGPLKSFQALMGEGEKFSRDKLYTKAIQCYTEALDLIPQDDDKASQKDINDRLNALVARSACYLKIGKNDLALQDAEESLKSNKEFTKGLYQKAEALYAMGEFELALMFYHRGKKLRPDLREFQLGINKAQEAIDNSVGDPNRVKLEASGDLSIFYKNDEDEAKKKKKQPMGYVRASQKKETAVQRKQHPPVTNPKTTKQLLGDLYEDRIFLDKIINNGTVTKPNTKSGDAIYQLASEGIDYLDSRTDFWRQQEPLYARSKAIKKPEGDGEAYKYIHRELETIDNLQNNDQFVDARRRAQHLVDFCERLDERKFSEKQSVLADVYSRLGNAYLELGDYNKALEYHNRDLRIAETKQYTERRSRALDNLGRVYARSGQFPQAIQVWERKIPLATSPLEKAWLFHEIGQCQFGLGDYEKAKRYGERSYSEAVAADDRVWQLNAKVLIAHSQTKLRQYREAEQTFNEALALARDQNDVAAERAIERAIKEVRDQIDKGAADSPPDRPETNYDIKVKSSDNVTYADDNLSSTMHLAIFGDNGSSGAIDLRNGETDPKKVDVRSLALKKKAFDAGKLTKLAITYDNIDSWPLEFIEVTDTKRKNKVKFLLPQPLESIADTVDLYPEGCIVPPSLISTGRDDQKRKAPSRLTKKPTEPETKPKVVEPAYDPNKKIDYVVTVQTGDVSNAGTDANVFITLNGDRNKLAKRQLTKPESGKDPFERNGRDVFKFTDTDIGRLKTITIEHDDAGMASAWFLEFVEVKCNNETVMFPVGRWLDKKEGDKRISLDLEPNRRPASKIGAPADPTKSTPYVVTVQTGNVSSSGTDAKVYITLNGDKNKIARRHLQKPDSSKDPFEKGSKDVFRFDDIDIGQLKTITIEHDDSGMASGWFLDWVEVKVKNDTTMFPVGRWLDKDEDDGKISLDLEPNKKPASKTTAVTPKPAVDPNKSTPYVVTVQTGNVSSSGTDAKVYITLNGDKNKIARRHLQKPDSGKDPFEKGSKDVFKFDDIDIGQLKTITIEHDDSGMASGWFLDWVEVKVKNDTTMFPVGRWLDKDEDDGKISLDLEPNKKPASKTTTEPPKPAVDPNKTTSYIVTTQTGSKDGAGTDAKVFITLNGDKNKITKFQLHKPEGGKDPFEKGSKDVFKFNDIDVGRLQTINIEHDGTSFGAGWYLESVEVKVNNDTYTFPVGRWLDKQEDDGRISLELEPNKKPPSKATTEPPKPAANPNNATSYVITVQTGDVVSGGTDSKVLITLNGDKNKITKYHLNKSETNKNPFEKGNKDVFKFNDIDVGKLKTIVIEHDDSGFASGWFLDWVEVKVNSEATMFPVGRWLDKQEDDGRISLELEPNKKPPSKATTEPPKPPSDPNKRTPYVVTVQTGSVNKAGTDANVYLTLNGDKNKIVRRQLQKPESGKDPFEKGNKDVFKFDEIDIGKLKTIVLEHDGEGLGAGWFVDSVEVKVKDDTTMFPVGRWLDVGEDDKRISLELEPNKKPGSKVATDVEETDDKNSLPTESMPEPKKSVSPEEKAEYDDFFDDEDESNIFDASGYDIIVRTGQKRGAGTDANVYLSLYGDKSKLERYQLKQSVDKKTNLFEGGAVDRFRINTSDLGKIQKIRIEHDGSGIGSGWYLDSIEVFDVSNERTYQFPVDRWLDFNEGDKRISLDLEPDKKPGQLTG